MCQMREGFVAAAAAFFTELDADNTRAFWLAHRARYDELLRPAFLELTAALGGQWRVYRPHNDTRFGRAAPYKTFLGAVTERPDGIGTFLQVGPRGLLVGTGIPMPARDQLERWRNTIGGPAGEDFPPAVEQVEAAGARVHPGRYPPLARVPRGWPADHRRGEWLRWKGIEVTHRPGSTAWIDTPRAPGKIQALIATGRPVHDWLAENVGPSALSPEERFARR
jgi:uncharacterized protein (DUF2461 family)